MLQALRKSTKSWTMRIILIGLAATFVVFFGQFSGGGGRHGGGHGGGNANPLVEVGGTRLTVQQISQAFNQEIQAVAPIFGGQLDTEQARRIGLLDRAVRRLVANELVVLGAGDLGVAISDDQVRQAIVSRPEFQNSTGQFDAAVFATFLLRAGLTEDQLVEQVRADIASRQYVNAVQVGGATPFTLAETVYNYREERRTAEYVMIGFDSFTDISAPTQAELATYFEAEGQVFQAPEYRAATIVSITPEELAGEIAVDEDEVLAEYEDRLQEFHVPEQRELQQAVFSDREGAIAARDRIDAGESYDAVVSSALGSDPVDLGQVIASDLLPEMADAAFVLGEDEVSAPVESPLGWHLIRATAVTPAETAPFEDVRDQLAGAADCAGRYFRGDGSGRRRTGRRRDAGRGGRAQRHAGEPDRWRIQHRS